MGLRWDEEEGKATAMNIPYRPEGLPEAHGLYDPRNEHDACGIGMIANINIPFPSGVSEYIRLASIAQLNLEIMQHGCVFGEADNAYYAKVRFCFWLPVFIVAALCVVYATERTVWRMRGSAQSEPPALASDRAERVRDRLCSVGCCMFNFLYVQRPSLRVRLPNVASRLLAGTLR